MEKGWFGALALASIAVLTACGSGAEGSGPANEGTRENSGEQQGNGEQTLSYLGQDYVLPENVERIVVTGAMEAMEDALVLDVEPIGAMTIGGAFPDMFAPITGQTEPIGEKTEPDVEKILALDPDVILASTKFPPEVIEELEKIAPTVQISHIATDWEDNLRFLAELTGKQEVAEESIAAYYEELEEAKAVIGDSLKDQTVLAVRVRNNDLYIYPETVFVNPILYEDLGIEAPEVTQAAEAQQLISTEQLAEINPDYLFIQDAAQENSENEGELLEQLQDDPILQNVPALAEGRTFVNVVDPLSEGGPSWSRIEFLNEAVDLLVD
ncbi:ABC transporter substrate-binding protein [Shouchella clausii]|jgi:iron complex transport system substrate-binding protein|uniref:ABC transporter substrate-binding protein n=1 Tax=Shouchella clausii TaxID=79880 RepID=UPI000B971741|nr:ABC transporter substrate-binding protein [Shouchella clausii]AST96302.1 iron-uptake system-binding protein [Shouchella clausii]MEB5473569.1 ABC transporter substrate-binding protein [Shouchella clausii]QNM42661.1 iron-uptake system-binding protein [Shouchella clausii]WQG94488.1 ABC transporter substrate-binding protein [Shouchella clausii]